MAKRNQFNKPTLSHVEELELNKLKVNSTTRFKNNVQVTGTVMIQGSAPEIRLKKSNPGAQMRFRIKEETIDLSSTDNWYKEESALGADTLALSTKFSSSDGFIPVDCRIDAIGLRVGTALGGDTGTNFLKYIGLTSSATCHGSVSGSTGINDKNYFFGKTNAANGAESPALAQLGPAAGSKNVYFPLRGQVSGSHPLMTAGQNEIYYTGITGSCAALYFELNEASRASGSFTYAIYYTQYGAPTS